MRHLLFFLFIQITLTGFSQRPVEWEFSFDQKNQEVLFTATMEEGWHLYSQSTKPDDGPIATSFQFKENESIKLKGKTQEPKAIEVYDENFESDLKFFKNEVSFTQRVRAKEKTSLSGSVTYMVCNATMCLPPVDENFEIIITN